MSWQERIPPLDFAEVKRLIPILDVLDRIGWRPTVRSGRSMKGNCPIHSRSGRASTSFSVRGIEWYCWTCRVGGDVTALWSRLTGLDGLRAALDLCRQFGISPPRRSG